MAEQIQDPSEEPVPSTEEDIQSQSENEAIPEMVQQESQTEGEKRATATPENQPEYDPGGGPLGCCLGISVGLFLSLILAVVSRLYADPLSILFQQNYGLLGWLVRILMALIGIGLAIFCGTLGWRLGKRFYREYDPPAPKNRKAARRLQQKV